MGWVFRGGLQSLLDLRCPSQLGPSLGYDKEKMEHIRPGGLPQEIELSMCKCEIINMEIFLSDFLKHTSFDPWKFMNFELSGHRMTFTYFTYDAGTI